jgi:O-antigen/teichoic acid export membrane protein
MTGHEKAAARSMAIGASLNIAFHLTMVPLWGIIGAALASTISMTIFNILMWVAARSKLNINSLVFKFQE